MLMPKDIFNLFAWRHRVVTETDTVAKTDTAMKTATKGDYTI